MRASGLWHPRLLAVVTALGHGDELVVGDAGLPVPSGVEAIDLLWSRGEPGFVPVLTAIAAEGVFESAVAAMELTDAAVRAAVTSLFRASALSFVTHDELKERCRGARAVVRTGEATPYANVVLRAGVPF